jgi:hypothetical protein
VRPRRVLGCLGYLLALAVILAALALWADAMRHFYA